MYQDSGLSYKGSRVQIPPARHETNGSKPLGLRNFSYFQSRAHFGRIACARFPSQLISAALCFGLYTKTKLMELY